jgi:hypothetical protein
MTPKLKKLLDKLVDSAEIVVLDKDNIIERIRQANELRIKAHSMLLESDILLDTIQKELLYGTDNRGAIKKSK